MKLRRHIPKLIALALSWLLVGWTGYTVAQALLPTYYIMGGIYPGAPNYTVWVDGSTYYAKNIYGQIEFESTNATAVIDDALESLTVGRTWMEKVLVKGEIEIDLWQAAGYAYGIIIYSFTEFELQGKIKLVDSANTVADRQNFILRVTDDQEHVYIHGGEIDGNMQNQPAPNYVYGVEVGNSENVHVENMFIHNTSETAIAFEGTSNNCWAIGNHVYNGRTDGIGNQYICKLIHYIGNTVEGYSGQGFYIEGGEGIVVEGNNSFNNTNGIYVTRGNETALISVTIANNIVRNNTYAGIQLLSYVTRVTITGNDVYFNHCDGITTSAHVSSVTINSNSIFNNNQDAGAHSGIIISNTTKHIIISGNAIFDNQTVKTQDWGVYEFLGADYNIISSTMTLPANLVGGIKMETAEGSSNSRIADSYNGTTWIHTWGTG